MKKTLLIIMTLAGLFLSASVSEVKAQTYYYYYGNKKIPLTLNESKVVVSVSKDCGETIERIRANVQALYAASDKAFDFFFITRSDFDKLTSQDFWEEDAKSVIITPGYIKDDDRGDFYREIFALPYVCITLKKDEDIDLLAPYLEKYRLEISWIGTWMTPIAVHLSLTLDSKKGPLEIANEMFESGVFAESCPGWALAGSAECGPNTVRSITTTQQPSPTFDLQGRRMSEGQPLQPGIYVKDGRKFVVK